MTTQARAVEDSDGGTPSGAGQARQPSWTRICDVDELYPNLGVCALVAGEAVAVFCVVDRDGARRYYAIGNHDPRSGASVLSRGLVGSLGGRTVVASPIYKQHFDLATGDCLEDAATPVRAYPLRVEDGQVWVAA